MEKRWEMLQETVRKWCVLFLRAALMLVGTDKLVDCYLKVLGRMLRRWEAFVLGYGTMLQDTGTVCKCEKNKVSYGPGASTYTLAKPEAWSMFYPEVGQLLQPTTVSELGRPRTNTRDPNRSKINSYQKLWTLFDDMVHCE
jgi:hypothetical protein